MCVSECVFVCMPTLHENQVSSFNSMVDCFYLFNSTENHITVIPRVFSSTFLRLITVNVCYFVHATNEITSKGQ